MIAISSEDQLRDAFRPIDREDVRLPADFTFPLVLKDYVSWLEPSGARVYLLFQDPNGLGARGVVFRRGSASSEPVQQMCQWCHAVRGGSAVRLLTVKLPPRKRGSIRTVGLLLCDDLSCKQKIFGTPNVNDLREPYTGYQKLFRVLMNMADFCRDTLGMKLDPAPADKTENARVH